MNAQFFCLLLVILELKRATYLLCFLHPSELHEPRCLTVALIPASHQTEQV